MTTDDPARRLFGEGVVGWVDLEPIRGREQGGRRPAVVVSGSRYLETVTTLALIVPVTTTDRGWPNHIELRGTTGLHSASWAMTEQIRTISRSRMNRTTGTVSNPCLEEIRTWLADFLDMPTPGGR